MGARLAVVSGESRSAPGREIASGPGRMAVFGRWRCSPRPVTGQAWPLPAALTKLGRCVMNAFGHWLLTVTGINNEAGKWYAFWSGFGANFGEVTLLAGVLAAWHRVNCHAKGCWRIGRQQVAGTTLVVCRRHHPDGKPTREHILELHRAHAQDDRIR